MTEDVIAELNAEKPSKFHEALLSHALGLVKMSRTEMSKHYSAWDLSDQVYRGERWPDDEDLKQSKKGKPVKMVVPHTFAQTMTFASFLFLMFNQRSPQSFFSLLPSGNEDYGSKEQDCENVIERDLRHNRWSTLLFQHLLDVGRFGPAINECCWTRKIVRAYVAGEPVAYNYNGVQTEVRGGSEWKEFVKYEGNLVRNVSPYRWFPDTRFPLVDFQRGEFCAAEEEYSKSMLRDLAKTGEVAGIDRVQSMPNDWVKLRGAETRTATEFNKDLRWFNGPSKSEGTVLVTKMQVRIVPSKFKFGSPEKKLGPEEFPVLYHLWYANDNRVIRCEPAYWWHDEFGWSLSQFTPDMHRTVNLGLADLIYRLQDVITWHINARITDVRRNMRGRLVYDPTAIEQASLNGDGDIYLKQAASKAGVDRWIKQLDTQDTTAGHMVDADLLSKIMEVVTGVNGNAMGQYNSGRRSAQESRTVTAGAAGRMKLHGHLIWDGGLGPLGRMMLSNSRQSLPQEAFYRAVGKPDPQDEQAVREYLLRYQAFKGTPEEVIGGDDYFTFDSTLSSEKGYMAQSLQELLVAIISSDPMAASRMTAGIDPVKLVEEVQYLRGSGNIKRFRYTPEERAAIQQQQIALEQAKQPAPKVSVSLAGKLTNSQEETAAAAAGVPGRAGDKVQETTSRNGSGK